MPVPPPTARLVFREMTPDDLDAMHGLLGDPVVMWVYPEPYTREQVAEWIAMNRRSYRDRGFGLWILALRETGEFVVFRAKANSDFFQAEHGRRLRPGTATGNEEMALVKTLNRWLG